MKTIALFALFTLILGTGGCALQRAVKTCHSGSSIEACEQACEGRDWSSCNRLGDLFTWEGEVPEDGARAIPYFELACDGGILEGCASLGALVEGGHGIEPDRERGVALLTRACDGGQMQGCYQLWSVYYYEGDYEASLPLARRACAAGVLGACIGLGIHYQHGAGVEMDLARAQEIWQEPCEQGEADACHQIAWTCDWGPEEFRDIPRALGLSLEIVKRPTVTSTWRVRPGTWKPASSGECGAGPD